MLDLAQISYLLNLWGPCLCFSLVCYRDGGCKVLFSMGFELWIV
jgi:hypothetical protein